MVSLKLLLAAYIVSHLTFFRVDNPKSLDFKNQQAPQGPGHVEISCTASLKVSASIDVSLAWSNATLAIRTVVGSVKRTSCEDMPGGTASEAYESQSIYGKIPRRYIKLRKSVIN